MVEPRPGLGTVCDRRFSGLDLVCEAPGSGGAVIGVPASRSLCVLDGRFEILNLESHVRPLRGCADGPPTTARSTLCPRLPVRSVAESPQTTRPRRPGLPRSQDSGSARPRALPSGRRTAEAPQQAVLLDPWPEITTSARHRPLVSAQPSQPMHYRDRRPQPAPVLRIPTSPAAVRREAGRRGIGLSPHCAVRFQNWGNSPCPIRPWRTARRSRHQAAAATYRQFTGQYSGSRLAYQPRRPAARVRAELFAAVGCQRLLGRLTT